MYALVWLPRLEVARSVFKLHEGAVWRASSHGLLTRLVAESVASGVRGDAGRRGLSSCKGELREQGVPEEGPASKAT